MRRIRGEIIGLKISGKAREIHSLLKYLSVRNSRKIVLGKMRRLVTNNELCIAFFKDTDVSYLNAQRVATIVAKRTRGRTMTNNISQINNKL